LDCIIVDKNDCPIAIIEEDELVCYDTVEKIGNVIRLPIVVPGADVLKLEVK
jgi:hypothetical protein